MFIIGKEQMAALAKSHVGRYLARDLERTGAASVYDPATGEIQVTPTQGQTTRLLLDDQGRVHRVTTPLARVYEYQFAGNHLAEVVSPVGLRTRFENDAQGRPVVVDRGGRRARFSYDDSGNLAGVQFPDETTLLLEHKGHGRLTKIANRLGQTVHYNHDEAQRLVGVVDGRGGRTSFEYSRWDRPDRAVFPDGSIESYGYGPTGFLERITCNDQLWAECFHDDGGHLAGMQFSDGHYVKFVYNDAGLPVEATNAEISVRCAYDEKGRILMEDQGGRVVRYRYDVTGRLEALALPGGATVQYIYDADGRLSEVRDWSGASQRFGYDTADQPRSRAMPSGLKEHYRRDKWSQLQEVALMAESNIIWAQQYQRDECDRIVRLTDSRHGSLKYGYDSEGQVIRAYPERAGSIEAFDYDANSNRIRINGTRAVYDSLNRVIQALGKAYHYDVHGNRVEESSRGGSTTYDYNEQNLLTKVRMADGTVVEYGYDAFARRVRKTVNGVVTRYIWAGHQMVREIIEEGAEKGQRDYLFAPFSHIPLAMRLNDAVYYYHNDHLGTPQLLTDQGGKVAWSARYRTLGRTEIETKEVSNPFRFPGHFYDKETGLHYNRARYYDPEAGVYLSRDPVGLLGGLNSYLYADGDPVHGSDPLGLFWEGLPGWAKTGVAIAGGIAAVAVVVLAAPVILPALGIAAGTALATGVTIAAAGMAAGATSFGINAAMTRGACVPCEMLRGLGIGALAALPFLAALAFPAVAAIAGGIWTLGGISGGIGYLADWGSSNQPWSTGRFLGSIALGAFTAGLGRFILGRLAPASLEEPPPIRSTTEADPLLGTSPKTGDFTGIKGSSTQEVASRIPPGATGRDLKPIPGAAQEGFEYKWTDSNGVTNRVRVHGPDPSAPVGSNAEQGWVARIQKGGKFADDSGTYHPRGIANEASPNYSEALSNDTHVPLKGNPAANPQSPAPTPSLQPTTPTVMPPGEDEQ